VAGNSPIAVGWDYFGGLEVTTVIVPDALHNQIHSAIDWALSNRPCTELDRRIIYEQILSFYYEHGRIPEFELKPVNYMVAKLMRDCQDTPVKPLRPVTSRANPTKEE